VTEHGVARQPRTCQGLQAQLADQFASLDHYMCDPIFWAYTVFGTAVLLVGYFYCTHVTLHMRWAGASIAQAEEYNYNFSVLLGLVGFPSSLLCGLVLDVTDRRTLGRLLLLQALLAVCVGGLSLLPAFVPAAIAGQLLPVQYLQYSLLVAWRINGFAIINSTFGQAFRLHISFGLGLTYTISGVLGVALTNLLKGLLQPNEGHSTANLPWESPLPYVYCGFTLLSVVSALGLRYLWKVAG
jgi:hypothetical protein